MGLFDKLEDDGWPEGLPRDENEGSRVIDERGVEDYELDLIDAQTDDEANAEENEKGYDEDVESLHLEDAKKEGYLRTVVVRVGERPPVIIRGDRVIESGKADYVADNQREHDGLLEAMYKIVRDEVKSAEEHGRGDVNFEIYSKRLDQS